jgi:hypothetical protein
MCVDKAARPIFDSVFLLIAWNLWKHQNGIIFQTWTSLDVARAQGDTLREIEDWVQVSFLTLSVPSGAWSHANGAM